MTGLKIRYLFTVLMISVSLSPPALSFAQQDSREDLIKIDKGEKKLEAPKTDITQKKRPWYARIRLSQEFDSNVIAQGKGVDLPTYYARSGDMGTNVYLAGGYRLYQNPKMVLWTDMRYNSKYYYYDYSNNYDLQYIEPSVRAAYRLNDEWIAGMRTEYSQAWVGYSDYGSWITINPSMTFLQTKWANINLAYGLRFSNYRYGITDDAQDKDGRTNYIQVTQNTKIPRTDISFSYGYRHAWTESSGRDYDHDDGTLFVNVWNPLFFDIGMVTGVSYTYYDYKWPNSRDKPYTRDDSIKMIREDDELALLVGVNRKIVKNVTGFANYEYAYNFSNLDALEYDRHLVTVGATYEF